MEGGRGSVDIEGGEGIWVGDVRGMDARCGFQTRRENELCGENSLEL